MTLLRPEELDRIYDNLCRDLADVMFALQEELAIDNEEALVDIAAALDAAYRLSISKRALA